VIPGGEIFCSTSDAARVDCCEAAVTTKVRNIKREYVPDPVDEQGGRKSSVINLNPRDGVPHDNSAPFSIGSFIVRQEGHAGLDRFDLAISLGYSQPETVPCDGPRHCVPQLGNVLVRVIQSGPLQGQLGEGRINEFVADRNASQYVAEYSCQLNTRRWPSSRDPDRSIHGR
jgi:hypothetical protein